MALKKITRHRAPIDGTTFRAMGNLNSLLRTASNHDDYCVPSVVNEIRVPIFVRMVKYQAQKTPVTPDGMIYGPVVRVGSMDSPEMEMFGHHWSAGLTQDYGLDGLEKTDKWLYFPLDGGDLNEDASFYVCDKCEKTLYRDDDGRRCNGSACIFDGSLVCRDCEVTGLVYDHETADQLARARKLAGFVGDECLARFERCIESIGRGFCWGHPSQTRLFREDRFSFNWSCVMFTPEGRKRGMNGGLICFGPHAIEVDNDRYEFRIWDYKLSAEREATHEEIKGIDWSIHT